MNDPLLILVHLRHKLFCTLYYINCVRIGIILSIQVTDDLDNVPLALPHILYQFFALLLFDGWQDLFIATAGDL